MTSNEATGSSQVGSTNAPHRDGSEVNRVRERAEQAFASGDLATAGKLFEQSAALGDVESLVWCGYIAEQEGNVDAGLRLYERAAEQGSGQGAFYLGDRLARASDHVAAKHWLEKAVEFGYMSARALLGEVRWRLGDRASGEQLLSICVREGDPGAMESLAMLLQKAGEISAEEWGIRMERAAERRIQIELEGQSWAHIQDFSQLSDDQLHVCEGEREHWIGPYEKLREILEEEEGEACLPDPVRDGDRLRAAFKFSVEWLRRRQVEAQRRADSARATADQARQNTEAFIAQHEQEKASRVVAQQQSRSKAEGSELTPVPSVPGDAVEEVQARIQRRWSGELPPDIPPLQPVVALPCRHLDPEATFENCELRFVERGVSCVNPCTGVTSFWMPWNSIESIAIETAEIVRQRATIPRLAAGGLFALGFKKTFDRSHVIVHHSGGSEAFFEIKNHSAMDTRVRLASVTEWLGRYGDQVRSHDYQ